MAAVVVKDNLPRGRKVSARTHQVDEPTRRSKFRQGLSQSIGRSRTRMQAHLSLKFDGTLNDANPLKEVVSPSVIDEHVAMEVQNPLVAQTYSVQSRVVEKTVAMECTMATATCKRNGKKVNVHTLFTPGGNGIDVVAYHVVANYVRNTWGKYGLVRLMFSSSTGLFSFQYSSMDKLDAMLENGPCEDGLSAISTKLGTPLRLDSYTSDICMQSWGRSSYARVMVELQVDVELKDNIVVAMPKITREGHYTCNVRVEYEWKPPRCSSCFKPQKEYRHVSKKPNASSCGNKKKGVKPTIEISNSNPFDVLNSVDNDGEFGTNRGTTNLVNNGATSSGSSFMNFDNDGEFASNTPIGEKIDKIERQIGEGKLRLLDNDGNPLVPTGFVESDSEVEVRDSYPDNDDYDPYDDDMYENHDLSERLQSICDDLDITIRGKKKK
uniref:DUF4283 domain-containing protein n=1 Tax=Tanacetum cinerariifolium TaxID=118510 RepID=A0A699GWR7_TANCI|nr:hypothetical protein [Tanacetum cinerariifolium]